MSSNNSFGFDASGCYNGDRKYFWAFDEYLCDKLRAAGVYWVIQTLLPNPVRPNAAIAHVENGTDDHYDRRDVEKYNYQMAKHQPSVEKAYGIVRSMLGSTPLTAVRHILDNENLSDRRKAQDIFRFLRNRDGAATETTKAAISNDIANLPHATDAESALQLISGLTHLNAILRKLGNSHHSDAALRTKLFEKLTGSMFDAVAHTINANAGMSFADACEAIRSSIDLTSIRGKPDSSSSGSGTKRTADEAFMFPGNIQSAQGVPGSQGRQQQYLAAGLARPPPRYGYEQVMQQQIMAIQRANPLVPPTPPTVAAATAPPLCWNCGAPDHLARDCSVLACAYCGSHFESHLSPAYHTSLNCPYKSTSRQAAPPPFVRYSGGKGKGKGGGRGGGRTNAQGGRGKFSGGRRYGARGNPLINAATAETTEDQEWEESMGNADPYHEYGWDYDDWGDYQFFNGATVVGDNVEVTDETVRRVLQDSGASTPVIEG
jgi:hypothetical protein